MPANRQNRRTCRHAILRTPTGGGGVTTSVNLSVVVTVIAIIVFIVRSKALTLDRFKNYKMQSKTAYFATGTATWRIRRNMRVVSDSAYTYRVK